MLVWNEMEETHTPFCSGISLVCTESMLSSQIYMGKCALVFAAAHARAKNIVDANAECIFGSWAHLKACVCVFKAN